MPFLTLPAKLNLQSVLFCLGMAIYVFSRFWGIEDFPIFFFCDEAYHQLQTQHLINNGFHAADGSFLPMYFEKAAQRWVPQISLYFYALPTYLFGQSIFITRGLHAIITILIPISSAYLLKNIFKLQLWWSAPLVFAILPTWFIHSRTALETVLVVSFFAVYLACYLSYLNGRSAMLYLAAFFAALCAYSHMSGAIVVIFCTLAFFISDLKFHLQHRRLLVGLVFFLAVLAIPAVRFQIKQGTAAATQLKTIDSHWFQKDLQIQDKIKQSLENYGRALSFAYWFDSDPQGELIRHRWGGRSNLPLWLLPFFLFGFFNFLLQIKDRSHRVLLLALFSSVTPVLLVEIGIMRVFYLIVPFSLLSIVGLNLCFAQIRRAIPSEIAETILFMALSCVAVRDTHLALKYGPTWWKDYGLYGMQYGAKQVFSEVNRILQQDPADYCAISVDWANGTETLISFFVKPEFSQRVIPTSAAAINSGQLSQNKNVIYVLSAADYSNLLGSPVVSELKILKIIPNPDGTAGFYVAKIKFVENIIEILKQRKIERSRLVETAVPEVSNISVVRHSMLDMGQVKNIFDADDKSLIRGLEANPFILEIEFQGQRAISGIRLSLGHARYRIHLDLYESSESSALSIDRNFLNPESGDVVLVIPVAQPAFMASKIRISLLEEGAEESHIHVRELTFNP